MSALTANEAALLSAVISAVTSIVVWLLTLRFGPDYKQQINSVSVTLKSMLEQHSRIAEVVQNSSTPGPAHAWEPTARIEAAQGQNNLVLKSDEEFAVEAVSILAPNNAVMADIPIKDAWVKSTGFRIPITPADIGKFWSRMDVRQGWATGTLRVQVKYNEERRVLNIPFMANLDFYNSAQWVKLTG